MNSTTEEEKPGPVTQLLCSLIWVFVLIVLFLFVPEIHEGMEKMRKQENARKITAFYESRWLVAR